VNFAKGLIKLLLIGAVMFALLWPQRQRLESLVQTDILGSLLVTRSLSLDMLGAVVAILFMVAAADYLFQYRQWFERQKMSVRELKEEFKQTEGDPMIKGKIRQLRQQRMRKRMMAAVPKASVVITNPTHYAIALQYERGMEAPVCVAKGTDLMALKIREIAAKHSVPIVENPPLARALHARDEIEPHILGEQRAHAVPVARVEKLGVARDQRRLRALDFARRGFRFAKARAAAMQRRFHRRQRQIEQRADLLERMTEHVLEHDGAPLRRREVDESRDRCARRLLARERVVRIGRGVRGFAHGVVDRLAHAHVVTLQKIERAAMRDAEQPGTHMRHRFHLRQRVVRAGQRVLHDVLAVADRPDHARAVAMQLGADLADELQEAASAFVLRGDQRGIVGHGVTHRAPGCRNRLSARAPARFRIADR